MFCGRTRKNYKLKLGGSNWMWKNPYFHSRIIKQFTQEGCRNSILGCFQDLPGENAKQSGLNSNVDPALSRKPGWKTSQDSFQNEWLCDSKASESIKMFLFFPLPDTCWYDTSLPLSVQNEEVVLWPSSIFSSSLFNGLSSSTHGNEKLIC